MKRSKKIILASHCILNSNSKVDGLSQYGGMFTEIIDILGKEDIGVIQLPCPEIIVFGMRRWGHTKDQFDTLTYRKKCRYLLNDIIEQIYAYKKIGYDIIGVLGVNGSPSCGVNLTCRSDNWYGNMSDFCNLNQSESEFEMKEEPGIFIEEFQQLLTEKLNCELPFIGINELNVYESVNEVKDFILNNI